MKISFNIFLGMKAIVSDNNTEWTRVDVCYITNERTGFIEEGFVLQHGKNRMRMSIWNLWQKCCTGKYTVVWQNGRGPNQEYLRSIGDLVQAEASINEEVES